MGTVVAVAGGLALVGLALFLILRGGGAAAPGPLAELDARRAERAEAAAETARLAEAEAELEKTTDVVDWLNAWNARRRGGPGGGDAGDR